MTPDEVKAWDDFIRHWSPAVKPSLSPDEALQMCKEAAKLGERPPESPKETAARWRREWQDSTLAARAYFTRVCDERPITHECKPFLTAKDIILLREMKIGL